MDIAKSAEDKLFVIIQAADWGNKQPPICVLCEQRIETLECFVDKKRTGFYLHPVCGNKIGVRFA